VYVLYDSRYNPPMWLSTWINTGESVIATDFNNTQLARNVFRKRYAAGSVTLPGNSGASSSVMYNVIAVPDPQPAALYRVNAGGAQVVSGNITWEADGHVTGGRSNTLASGDIANTADDVLYYTERSADIPNNELSFTYDFPVTNGTYTVRLHFAELWWTGVSGSRPSGTGRRVFDVQIEGLTVLEDYDITASAGAPLTADVKLFEDISVTDGLLTIHFPPASVDHPSISAIEVFAVP
jgi:large repetitive protein